MATNPAMKIWESIRPMVDREIDERMRSCLRMKKMMISTAYNASTGLVGVMNPFDNETFVRVAGDMDTSLLTKGNTAWVLLPYGDMSHAIILMRGDGAR